MLPTDLVVCISFQVSKNRNLVTKQPTPQPSFSYYSRVAFFEQFMSQLDTIIVGAERRTTMPKTYIWLPRVLFESILIVMSIMLALALDEWRDNKQKQELVVRSMESFAKEIQRNKSLLEDVNPFHHGLTRMLQSRAGGKGYKSATEFRNIVRGFRPAVLINSAWETAVATGALGQMEYDMVSALSLTYSFQQRFNELTSATNNVLSTQARASDNDMNQRAYEAARYVSDVTAAEDELLDVYQQALELIQPPETEK